jgi:hypothetical protein
MANAVHVRVPQLSRCLVTVLCVVSCAHVRLCMRVCDISTSTQHVQVVRSKGNLPILCINTITYEHHLVSRRAGRAPPPPASPSGRARWCVTSSAKPATASSGSSASSTTRPGLPSTTTLLSCPCALGSPFAAFLNARVRSTFIELLLFFSYIIVIVYRQYHYHCYHSYIHSFVTYSSNNNDQILRESENIYPLADQLMSRDGQWRREVGMDGQRREVWTGRRCRDTWAAWEAGRERWLHSQPWSSKLGPDDIHLYQRFKINNNYC